MLYESINILQNYFCRLNPISCLLQNLFWCLKVSYFQRQRLNFQKNSEFLNFSKNLRSFTTRDTLYAYEHNTSRVGDLRETGVVNFIRTRN